MPSHTRELGPPKVGDRMETSAKLGGNLNPVIPISRRKKYLEHRTCLERKLITVSVSSQLTVL